eukprot:3220529-Rhodomonas_salina.4
MIHQSFIHSPRPFVSSLSLSRSLFLSLSFFRSLSQERGEAHQVHPGGGGKREKGMSTAPLSLPLPPISPPSSPSPPRSWSSGARDSAEPNSQCDVGAKRCWLCAPCRWLPSVLVLEAEECGGAKVQYKTSWCGNAVHVPSTW